MGDFAQKGFSGSVEFSEDQRVKAGFLCVFTFKERYRTRAQPRDNALSSTSSCVPSGSS